MVNAPSIGGGIVLGVVGAILAFAVGPQVVAGINLQMVGYICLIAAVVMIILGLVLGGRRRQSVQRTESVQRGGEAPVVRETRTDVD